MVVRDWAAKGYESENIEVNFKIWFDLIITGSIIGEVNFEKNTASDSKILSAEMGAKLAVELTAGVELKAKALIVKVGSVDITGHASAGVKLEITSGHHLKYETYKGLIYKPTLTLPPCIAQTVVYIEIALSYKVVDVDWKPININRQRKFWEEEINIIENLEDISGRKAELKLI